MSSTLKSFRIFLKQLRIAQNDRSARNLHILTQTLKESRTIREPNFSALSAADLHYVFDCYDELYFEGQLKLVLKKTPLEFRVSSRMIRAAGKTSSWRKNRRSPIERLEIAISSTLLSQTFSNDQAGELACVTGIECHTRLDALMRVMEHEMVHLAELLGWNKSSCRQDRFQGIAWQVFGHTDHRHGLITPYECAGAAGIHPGGQVRFEFQGQILTGIVNRVTRRATVLVPAANGEIFSDGISYCRYYVPIRMLEPVDGHG